MALVTIPDPDEVIKSLTDPNVPVKVLIQRMIDFMKHTLDDRDRIDDLSIQLAYIDMFEKVAKGLDQNAIRDEATYRIFIQGVFQNELSRICKNRTTIEMMMRFKGINK